MISKIFCVAKHAWNTRCVEVHSLGYEIHYSRGNINKARLHDREKEENLYEKCKKVRNKLSNL